MKMVRVGLAVALVLTCGTTAGRVYGQAQAASENAASCADYKSFILADAEDVGQKLIELVQAMPADKFTARSSGEGVLSVSEVFLLAATQYYHLPNEWGALQAKAYETDGNAATGNRVKVTPLEKSTTDKQEVVNQLVDAVSYFDGIMKTLTDSDMQKPIKIYGYPTTPDRSLFVMTGDLHEYLAQAMNYARANGVVLPWMTERLQLQQLRGQRSPIK